MNISLKNIAKSFGNNVIFRHIDYEFPPSGLVGISGDSGCGKSTLLKIIAGLERCEGEVYFGDLPFSSLSDEDKARYRGRNIGFLTQHNDLFINDTLANNLLLPLAMNGETRTDVSINKINNVLHYLDLHDKKKRHVRFFSGGEIKRSQLARAVIHHPHLILCDEPTNGLDNDNSVSVMNHLKELSRRSLVIVVSHDKPMIERYCDEIISLAGGNLRKTKTSGLPESRNSAKPSAFRHKKRKIPASFSIRHNYELIKGQKGRHLAVNFVLMISFMGLGLSSFIKDGLSSKIDAMITSLVGTPQIMVEKKNRESIKTEPATKLAATMIREAFPEDIAYDGVYYENDINSFFPDGNDVLVNLFGTQFLLPSFKARDINDFFHVSDFAYLRDTYSMKEDEIILGMPKTDLNILGSILGVGKNDFEINDYLASHRVTLTISLANEDWTYEDEQILSLVKVFASSYPCFVHTDYMWNEYMLETRMRFPVADGREGALKPWDLRKVHYVKEKVPFTIIDKINLRPEFRNILADYFDHEDLPYVCLPDRACASGRVKLFYQKNKDLDVFDLENIRNSHETLGSYIVGTEEGYILRPESLITGFLKPAFISSSDVYLEQVTDLLSFLTHEEQSFSLLDYDHVLSGQYLTGSKNGFRLTPNRSYRLYQGTEPEKTDEIAVSKALYAYLFGKNTALTFPKDVYFAMEKSFSIDRDGNKDSLYYQGKLSVTSCFESHDYLMYGVRGFEYRYLRDYVGLSGSQLVFREASFDYKGDDTTVIGKIGNEYPYYLVHNPLKKIRKDLRQSTGIFNHGLTALTVFASLNSIILLLVIINLSLKNRDEEHSRLVRLGADGKMVLSFDITYIAIVVLSAFVSSSVGFIFISYFLHLFINDYLFIDISYSFPFSGVVNMMFFAVFMLFICVFYYKKAVFAKK